MGDIKIFVGNIAEGSDSDELSERFAVYGEVTECDIIANYAFVHMSDLDSAKTAIENLNQSVFNGKNIRCELSTNSTQGRKRARESGDTEARGGRGGSSWRGGDRGRGGGGPSRNGFGRGYDMGRGGGGMRGRGGRGGGGGGRYEPYPALSEGREYDDDRRRPGPSAYMREEEPYSRDPYQLRDALDRDLLYRESYWRERYLRDILGRDTYGLPPAPRESAYPPRDPYDPYERPPPDYYSRTAAGDPALPRAAADPLSGDRMGYDRRLPETRRAMEPRGQDARW